MPEQDDDALGDILSDRLKGTKDGDEEDETDGGDDEPEEATEAGESPGSEDGGAGTEASASVEPDSTGSTESAQPTQRTGADAAADGEASDGEASDSEAADGDATEGTVAADDTEDAGTTRSRSPFPLYIRPSLKASVNDRFDRFNAERTLDDEPQVEKHAHFIQGLLRAGLDHPDLEEYVLEEFREE